jgi:16S rRNA (adenine(1408)-N(1))-methyltransferase
VADSITINFPWGSLLRGVLGQDDEVLAGVAQLMAPGATLTALVSVVPRDGLRALPERRELEEAYVRQGLTVETRPATVAEVAGSASSWAKRLRAPLDRPVTLLRAAMSFADEPGRLGTIGSKLSS